jgi:hypothetical protein
MMAITFQSEVQFLLGDRTQCSMDPIINLNTGHAGLDANPAALLFNFEKDDPQLARAPNAQQLLFASDPRSVCQEIGLNWWAAIKLFEDGWLSFSPESPARLDEAQECELRFVGALVVAGCDRNIMVSLLATLPKPYSYKLNKLFFDWQERRWRLLPETHPHPETVFTDWLELLTQRRDLGSLSGILELTQDAIACVNHTRTAAQSSRSS